MLYIKYRPHDKTELLYNKHKLNIIKSITTNMLISGNSGIGKNTLINIYLKENYNIINTINKTIKINNKTISFNVSNYHFEIDIYNYLNRNNAFIALIKELSSTHNILNQNKKIFVIKNVDQLTKSSQLKLRKLLERIQTQFIFSTSYLSKIIEPLRSRFLLIRIPSPTKDDKIKVLKTICKGENIKISTRSINILLAKTDNIKELITLLQICYQSGKFKNKNLNYINILNKIIKELDKLSSKNYKKFRDLIYSLKLLNIPYCKYIHYITKSYAKKIDSETLYLLYGYAAECDSRILQGNKPDIHFERFLLQIKTIKPIKNI